LLILPGKQTAICQQINKRKGGGVHGNQFSRYFFEEALAKARELRKGRKVMWDDLASSA